MGGVVKWLVIACVVAIAGLSLAEMGPGGWHAAVGAMLIGAALAIAHQGTDGPSGSDRP